jgi:hypothetical protein
VLDPVHAQAEPAGDDLEALVLERVDVIRSRRPGCRCDPVDLQQLAVRPLGGLAEDRAQAGRGVKSSSPLLAMSRP